MIVATGSDAKMLPGLEPDSRVLTNMEILSLKEIPKSLIVIGAGAVGVEFGSDLQELWRGDHHRGGAAATGAE